MDRHTWLVARAGLVGAMLMLMLAIGLVGPGSSVASAQENGKVTICHRTGNGGFVEITVSANAAGHLDEHRGHSGDVVPAPAEGCASLEVNGGNNPNVNQGNEKITICHRTGSETNPYVEITVSVNAAGHLEHNGHSGDIVPAPAEGCPSLPNGNPGVPQTLNICVATGVAANPYAQVTINLDDLGDYVNGNNIIPVPENGCPTAEPTVTFNNVDICVPTGVDGVYALATVSENVVGGFLAGGAILLPPGGCPGLISNDLTGNDVVTFCFATGNLTWPYLAVTVDRADIGNFNVNGNIIPMPAEGCPAGPVSSGLTVEGDTTVTNSTTVTGSTTATAGVFGSDMRQPGGTTTAAAAGPAGGGALMSSPIESTQAPFPASTGSAGLRSQASNTLAVLALGAFALTAVAGARFATRKG